MSQSLGVVYHFTRKSCLPPHFFNCAAALEFLLMLRKHLHHTAICNFSVGSFSSLDSLLTCHLQARALRTRARLRMTSAWSQWLLLMRHIRAFQRLRMRLRRLRQCFRAWAAEFQLQCAVLAALSLSDAPERNGSPPEFVRARPHVHSSVQTVRLIIHPSLSVVIHRLVLCAVVPFLHIWRRTTRHSCALRWGIKRTCAHVMRVWVHRLKQAEVDDDQHNGNVDFVDDDQRWQQLISLQSAPAPQQLPGLVSSITASSLSKTLRSSEAMPKTSVSRRSVYFMNTSHSLTRIAA
jgi:hypothetical protein